MPKVATRTFHARRQAQPWKAVIDYDPNKEVFSISLPKWLHTYHPDGPRIVATTQTAAENAAAAAIRRYDESEEITKRVICYSFDTGKRSHNEAGLRIGFWAVVVDETEKPFIRKDEKPGASFEYIAPEGYRLNDSAAADKWKECCLGGWGGHALERHSPQIPYTLENEVFFLRMAEAIETLAGHFLSLQNAERITAAIERRETFPALPPQTPTVETAERCPSCGEIITEGAQLYECNGCGKECCTPCSNNERHGVLCDECHTEKINAQELDEIAVDEE